MVTMQIPFANPKVASELEEELASPTLSGTRSTVHRHSLSKPRAHPATGPTAKHTQPLCVRAESAPVRHTRPAPTDRVPPLLLACVIANTPAPRQTNLFAAARPGAPVRH